MIEKFIAPIVVGVVVGFILLFGSDVKEIFLPERQVEYEIISSEQLLGPKELGRKERSVLGSTVSNVYLSQIRLESTGKTAIDDLGVLVSIEVDNKPKLYRVFYATEPSELFGDVSFSTSSKPFEHLINIEKFVENTVLTISIVSSEPNPVTITINKSGVDVKNVSNTESAEDLTYVALMSAAAVLVGRFLIDISFGLLALWRRKKS